MNDSQGQAGANQTGEIVITNEMIEAGYEAASIIMPDLTDCVEREKVFRLLIDVFAAMDGLRQRDS